MNESLKHAVEMAYYDLEASGKHEITAEDLYLTVKIMGYEIPRGERGIWRDILRIIRSGEAGLRFDDGYGMIVRRI